MGVRFRRVRRESRRQETKVGDDYDVIILSEKQRGARTLRWEGMGTGNHGRSVVWGCGLGLGGEETLVSVLAREV